MNRTRFFQLIELAETYAKDGAWATAADRLRSAADMAEEEAKRRADLFEEQKAAP
ncbi:hypothetical protein SAMN05216376_111164 [Mameliella alba]|uniref:hypothetical protein n=1 Tax=Mameliella alba TaxID=561184 RepID=UPI00088C5C97|nr:hypothetical protein [Mameliella alba]PTR37260.1 hypothetical protein LX94_03599 [Mameliella alba]GGF73324.1 hypothetical protein GCM10011319_37310 [Mameliella alba]SDD77739.1 hypothetical protein SAMN05216376_111164 [Mameliella alba]